MALKSLDKLSYEFAYLRREDGILEVRLHTNDGPFVWNEVGHRALSELFYDIGTDVENRVMILTGTGDSYCDSLDGPSFAGFTRGWDKTYWEGRRLLQNLLEIDIPIVAAINGPATFHAEIPLLSDIAICSDTTIFRDSPHFDGGSVPGDGVHIVWPELLGPNRGRYFLMTGQAIDAAEALRVGLVGEVLPIESLLPRAWEIARMLSTQSTLKLRYTRVALTQKWKKLLVSELSHGLALEGLAIGSQT